MSLTIWCNLPLAADAQAKLMGVTVRHRLLLATTAEPSDTHQLDEADVAFGQPDPERCAALTHLAWVHLSSAGYTAYDNPSVRTAFARRKAALTNSSAVYADPCAEHALSFMLADARQLPRSFAHQLGDRAWTSTETRASSILLRRQTVALVGFGAIARRLAALLAPFSLEVVGVRRAPLGNEGIPVVALDAADALLGRAHHVVNLLPATRDTVRFFDARRFALLRPGARFYNIGRGSTVDHEALRAALEARHLGAAYLDVADPEPLPPDHPLWSTPGCFITPHSAGGHAGETVRLVEHFLSNLDRYVAGQPLQDRVF